MKKKSLIIFLLINFLISLSLLFLGLWLGSIGMQKFDRPQDISQLDEFLLSLGSCISGYLMAFVYLLPKAIRYSSIGGVLSYISTFVMTIPLTFGLFMLFGRFKKSKTEAEKLG